MTKTQSPWRQRQLDWQLRSEIVHGCVCGWSVSGRLEETMPAFHEHAETCPCRPRRGTTTRH